ncbi:hypothetical protein AB0I28_32955 [Phytomonospora sp. NPDC050363]|uniref:hypothetical protein n=1 Tax=Phytomonospora sp. NPDC050363 TaxID=3155642 RepID=UPI0033DC9017
MDIPPEHPDLASDLVTKSAQGLALLATTWSAWRVLDMARQRDRDEAAASHAAWNQHLAEHEAAAQRRMQMDADRDATILDMARDPEWIAEAGLADLGAAWRTGQLRRDDPLFNQEHVEEAIGNVENRLWEMYPRAQWTFERLREQGADPTEAMRAAVDDMVAARPHPGRAAHLAITAADFQTAYNEQITGLADQLGERYLRELENLGYDGAGEVAATLRGGLSEALRYRAGDDRKDAATAAAMPDDPATTIDEHLVTGRSDHGGDHGHAAAHDAAAATEEHEPAIDTPVEGRHPAELVGMFRGDGFATGTSTPKATTTPPPAKPSAAPAPDKINRRKL